MIKWTFLFLFITFHLQAAPVLVTKEFCQHWLSEHMPRDDVTYRPQDYKGIPADIGGAIKIDLPESVTLDIEIDLPAALNLYSKHIDVGQVTYDKDGRLSYNGQPLYQRDLEKMKKACQLILDNS